MPFLFRGLNDCRDFPKRKNYFWSWKWRAIYSYHRRTWFWRSINIAVVSWKWYFHSCFMILWILWYSLNRRVHWDIPNYLLTKLKSIKHKQLNININNKNYGTYGLDVQCKTKFNPNHKDGPAYETEIKATSDYDEKHDVATVKVTFALNEAE